MLKKKEKTFFGREAFYGRSNESNNLFFVLFCFVLFLPNHHVVLLIDCDVG